MIINKPLQDEMSNVSHGKLNKKPVASIPIPGGRSLQQVKNRGGEF